MTESIRKVTLVDYRDSPSSNASSLEDLTAIGAKSIKTESDDSEEEFNRILEICRPKKDRKTVYIEDDYDEIAGSNINDSRRKQQFSHRTFDPEYYGLPEVEDLQIHVEDDIVLKKFGVVHQFIDFIVIIKPFDGVKHLDYDTMLFNEERNVVGQVFEVFGKVKSAMYSLRFNSTEEANNALKLGQKIYYAPDEKVLTKVVLANELMKMKISDENTHSGDDIDFSDDDAEAAYFASKRSRKRNILQREKY